MPTMNRAEMEQVIRDGGSVLHRGQILNSLDTLPTEAALAKASDDPVKKAAAREALLAQQKAIQDAIDGLDGTPATPAAVPATDLKLDDAPKPRGK